MGEWVHRLHGGFVLGERYRLESQIAVGGMGDVWAAVDLVLSRTVAAKIMHPSAIDEQLFAQRFRAEARHTARLSHPNIATLFDYGEDDHLAYLIMELVEGQPLSAALRSQPRPPTSTVRSIIGQAALALAAAHRAGVVHRDVKPANVLIKADGQVKLTDFGISRALDGSGQTRTGEILGTPHYLSPEQALGEPATPASDIYSLGVIAHEMLSGTKPFDRGTPVATALSHITEPPPPLPEGVDEDLAALVSQCLAKDPRQRPASAAAIAEVLGLNGILALAPFPAVDGTPAAEHPEPTDSGDGRTPRFHPAEPLGAPSPNAESGLDVVPEHGRLTDDDPAGATMGWTPQWTQPVPLRDLETILAQLSPQLHDGTYAVVSVPEPIPDAHPYMTLVEAEGLTMLLRQEEAESLGLEYELPLSWITLGAYRAIGSVGLVATATTALAQASIPAVAGVGRWHTHIFVPATDTDRAMKVLHRLSAAHRDG